MFLIINRKTVFISEQKFIRITFQTLLKNRTLHSQVCSSQTKNFLLFESKNKFININFMFFQRCSPFIFSILWSFQVFQIKENLKRPESVSRQKENYQKNPKEISQKQFRRERSLGQIISNTWISLQKYHLSLQNNSLYVSKNKHRITGLNLLIIQILPLFNKRNRRPLISYFNLISHFNHEGNPSSMSNLFKRNNYTEKSHSALPFKYDFSCSNTERAFFPETLNEKSLLIFYEPIPPSNSCAKTP